MPAATPTDNKKTQKSIKMKKNYRKPLIEIVTLDATSDILAGSAAGQGSLDPSGEPLDDDDVASKFDDWEW